MVAYHIGHIDITIQLHGEFGAMKLFGNGAGYAATIILRNIKGDCSRGERGTMKHFRIKESESGYSMWAVNNMLNCIEIKSSNTE